jgi:hypothetical protein
VWQHHQAAVYCLYGSKRHMLSDIFQKKSMPFYRFGHVTYLPKIAQKELVNFVVRNFNKTGKTISREKATEITEIMKCHPYHVQELSHFIWLKTEDQVHSETITNALNDLHADNMILYQREVDNLTTQQLYFLKAITDGNKSLYSNAVIHKYNLGSSSNVVKLKNALEKKEVIDAFGKEIELINPAFEHWFKQYFA